MTPEERAKYERYLDQCEEWANEIEPDMSDWEAEVTARNEELDAEARDEAEWAERRREERRARVQRILQGLERWAGLLILAAMGAAAADMFGQGHWKAGSLGLLFLLALIACYRRLQRLLQRERDQAHAASLPADMRACRVEQQGTDLVFRDLESEALLLPLRIGDVYYLADPESMPQSRNRRPSDG